MSRPLAALVLSVLVGPATALALTVSLLVMARLMRSS